MTTEMSAVQISYQQRESKAPEQRTVRVEPSTGKRRAYGPVFRPNQGHVSRLSVRGGVSLISWWTTGNCRTSLECASAPFQWWRETVANAEKFVDFAPVQALLAATLTM